MTSRCSAYAALRETGLRVWHDMGVVGFADVPIARWSDPTLTTVRQPLQARPPERCHV
ncbi:substrate-binding domain-containing protein [Streptomyces sp. NPDC005784]|uniref:substrate-binding domain-containing protein n=1 Tax=Streptomyces sp. NPDC005784 TaxID=3364731 RepID=UPI0036A6B013